MRITRMLAIGAAALALIVSACGPGGGSKPTVKVGSDGFYEARLMAEIYAQALEAKGYTVDRTGIGVGARTVSAPALESGQFDLKPEYLGSGLAFYDATKVSGDPAANRTALQAILDTKGGGITVLEYSPASDYNAFVVTKETADEYQLTSLSDLAEVADELEIGVATDCPTNPVCGEALMTAYGIDVADATLLSACDTPMVQALLAGTIQVAELCSTQPEIAVNGWVILEDDKMTQPAENLAPLVRDSLLTALGDDRAAFEQALNDVSAKLTTAMLTDLGKQVQVDKKDIAAVAKAWLQSVGLVPA
jgi:osmoprotectant transport system substrate-binding protein